RRTIRSYSYQWRKFKQMFPQWEDLFLESIAPIDRDFFRGRIGLDGGCGFGRSLFYAASFGAEMIGLDLSEAIEAARENTGHLPNVHLVQGDIFRPPVRPQALDFVYSIGVLHHLPDPRKGFLSLAKLLKPGAPMFVWVYLRGRGRQIRVFTVMRWVAARLPLKLLNLVCLALAVGQFAAFILPRRLLSAVGGDGLGRLVPFSAYARYPFRALHTDWFDGLSVPLVNYYKPHEIAAWYQDGGFEHVQIGTESEWNGRALGYAPAGPAPSLTHAEDSDPELHVAGPRPSGR
ncbi:MAG: class I SAM-dependent methyltransferase, partial [Acidobacteriota bacterium]